MTPFPDATSIFHWWVRECSNRPVGILLDFADIGLGQQRREMHRGQSGWILGFPDANPLPIVQVAWTRPRTKRTPRRPNGGAR